MLICVSVLDREVGTVSDVMVTSSNSLIKLKRDVTALSDSVHKLRSECEGKVNRLERVETLISQTNHKMSDLAKTLQAPREGAISPSANLLVSETDAKMSELSEAVAEIKSETRVGGGNNGGKLFFKKTSAHLQRWDELMAKHQMSSTAATTAGLNNNIESSQNISPKAVKSAR